MPLSADSTTGERTTHHRTPMHLESLAGIASAKVGVENHLMVDEVGVKVAGALEVRDWWSEFAQNWCR
jgi:hypothetical protein